MFDAKFCQALTGASPNLRELPMLMHNVIATNPDISHEELGRLKGPQPANS